MKTSSRVNKTAHELSAYIEAEHWSPEDPPDSQNMLVYILEHPSRHEAETNWAAFQADPEWKKVKVESEMNGPLVDHIDGILWIRQPIQRSGR